MYVSLALCFPAPALRCFRLRGQSILLFLDSQLTLELDRADVSQRRVPTLHVVQLDNKKPIVPRSQRSTIRGIRGLASAWLWLRAGRLRHSG